MKRLIALTTLFATAPAWGQSLNIDINRNAAGFTAPSAAYGAAAGQPGSWNMVNGGSSGTQTLVGLNGGSSGCTITKDGVTGSSTAFPGTGDWASLIEDYDRAVTPNSNLNYTISGLDEGLYFVYVYACSLGADAYYIDTFGFPVYYYNYISAYVGGSNAATDSSLTTGEVVANQFQQGVTHAMLVVPIGPGAPELQIRVHTGANTNERCAINGIQLVKVETNRLYVNAAAPAGGNGLGWSSALTNLKTAITTADDSNGAINEIWVAAGEYYPSPNVNRFATFDIPSGLKLYGGFAGDEANLADRDVEANVTIMSGDPAQTDTLGDNAYHVVTATGVSSATRIDGFTIREGQATGAAAEDKDGAALYIDGGTLRVFNCKFELCQAESEGGHVYITNNAAPDFINCSFYNGYAVQFGGSIRNTSNSNFSAWNCFFGFNGADINGGAINSTSEEVGLYNCVFSNNFASSNGGAVYIFGSTATADVVNCTLAYNDAGDFDTAGSIGGLGAASSAVVNVKNCIFYGNTDTSGATSIEAANLGEQSGANIIPDYCIVQGWTGGLGGAGNFAAVPQFVDANGPDNSLGTPDDNYTLMQSSPGVDAGRTANLPNDTWDLDGDLMTFLEPVPFDIYGNARQRDLASVVNGAVGFVDIGAAETQPVTLGDMNCDGSVDFFDIDPFLEALFDPAGYAAAFPGCNILNGDLNSDGLVNFFDIDPFVACVFGACP